MARARFIGRGKPWMWRSVHAISYLMWPIALVHGLSAGRPAATWVIVSYVVCILFVLVGLAVRLSVSLNRRKDFSSTSTGSMKPVGSLVPTTAPVKKRSSGRRRDADPMDARVVADRGNAPAAVLESWTPAVPPVSAQPAPISPAPYEQDYQRGARSGRYAEPDERGARARRYAEDQELPARRYAEEDEPPAPRQRRAAASERFDEPTRPMSRRAVEDDRYRHADDEVPLPRSRRRADEEDPYGEGTRSRARRVVEENRATRSARYVEDEETAPRARRAAPRYADEDDAPAPRTRRRADEERRYAEDDGYGDVPRSRGSGEARRSGAHTGEFRTGELRPGYDRTGEFRMDEGPASPRSRPAARYEDEPAPRSRRADRRGDVDRADSGRHSRSEFVDLAAPADPWGAADDAGYPPPDDTPTLVDMASRRARRASQQEVVVRGGAGRGARGTRTRDDDESADDQYWRQLRGEAQ
jgi:hypothetical protein